MNVDLHTHCNSADEDEVRAYVETCEKNDTFALLSGGLHYGGYDYVPNEEVLEIAKRYPNNLGALAKLDLWDTPPDVSEARRYADMGVKGFKFIYPYYAYNHESYLPLYEEIEKLGLPMLFHTGAYRQHPADRIFRRPVLENMSPITLDAVARYFQDAKIVIAHMGTSLFRKLAADLVKLHPNLYFDLAGNGAFLGVTPHDLAELLRPANITRDVTGANFLKLVFGSDSYIKYPYIQTEALAAYRNIIMMNRIPEEDANKILGGTVASWIA